MQRRKCWRCTFYFNALFLLQMLNRRTLRIKTMQALFAYNQSKESNYNIAKLESDEAFAPDLNSMEVQDKALLSAQAKECKQIFEKNYLQYGISITEGSDEKVNIVATKAINNYHIKLKNEVKVYQKQMVADAEDLLERYLMLLQLITDFAGMAETIRK